MWSDPILSGPRSAGVVPVLCRVEGMMGYHRNPESRITQAQQRRRRGMSFRVHFLLIDLENALHALEYFEALRDAALPRT